MGSVQDPEFFDWLLAQSYMTGLQAGRVLTLTTSSSSPGTYKGTAGSADARVLVQLYTPAAADRAEPTKVLKGFLAVDANYAGYYNRPNIASYRVTVVPLMPGVVIETDQFTGTPTDGGRVAILPASPGVLNFAAAGSDGTFVGVATEPVVPSHHIGADYGLAPNVNKTVSDATVTQKVIRVYCG